MFHTENKTVEKNMFKFHQFFLLFISIILILHGCTQFTPSDGKNPENVDNIEEMGKMEFQEEVDDTDNLLKKKKNVTEKKKDGTSLENKKKIDQLYHRLSVLQFIVDNHERTIKDLEKENRGFQKEIAGKDKIEESNLKPSPLKTNTPKKSNKETTKALLSPKKIDSPSISSKNKSKNEKTNKEYFLKSANELYKKAFNEFKKHDYERAVLLFSSLVKHFPVHSLANNSLYWIGEIYYDQKLYKKAITYFKQLIKMYPKGNKVPDALLKTGYSYLALEKKKKAIEYFRKVVTNYPFTNSGSMAEKKLQQFDR